MAALAKHDVGQGLLGEDGQERSNEHCPAFARRLDEYLRQGGGRAKVERESDMAARSTRPTMSRQLRYQREFTLGARSAVPVHSSSRFDIGAR